MSFVTIVRELTEGLKLGTRYAFSEKHNLVEKGVQPRVTRVNTEGFGR